MREANAIGSVRAQNVITVSGGGQTTTTRLDSDGDGVVDRVTTVATLANGDRVETVTRLDADNQVIDRVVETTGATGLARRGRSTATATAPSS